MLTLVGSVRPVDVRSSNRVSSSYVGELTVRMWGRGEIDNTIRQGWFMRIMNRVWPSTAAMTGLKPTAGSPCRRSRFSHRTDGCWSKLALARRQSSARFSGRLV